MAKSRKNSPKVPPLGLRYKDEGHASDGGPTQTESPDYWRGYEVASANNRSRKELEEQKLHFERERARSHLTVELGENTVTFRDGVGHIICRIDGSFTATTDRHIHFSWHRKLAELLSARGTKNFTIAISEQLGFTIQREVTNLDQNAQLAGHRKGLGYDRKDG